MIISAGKQQPLPPFSSFVIGRAEIATIAATTTRYVVLHSSCAFDRVMMLESISLREKSGT